MRIHKLRWLLGLTSMLLVSQHTSVHAGSAKPKGPVPKLDLSVPIAALASGDTDAAVNAMTQLGTLDSAAAHDAILDGLAFGPHPLVVLAALPALIAHPAPADAAVIARYATYRSVVVRSAALQALASYPDPKAKLALVKGLSDSHATVRAAAAAAIAKARLRDAVPALLTLLEKGEIPAAVALGHLADVEIARAISEKLGQVPDEALATCLGTMLKRDDFGPDTARVQVVAAIGKISSNDAIIVLSDYIESTPKNPPRQSRKDAEAIVEARLGVK
ncbi:MAG: HEAT repeat domain-containing protein [Kofleriaceae bacterium]|nr:HEAT repeat domain-containing protein [Kofleriaceae bacterium]